MNIFTYIFLAIIIISLISLVGIFTISIKEREMQKILPLLVSLSVGTLLGGFFIHILPELVENSNNNFSNISIFILIGILFFYLTEKIIHWHHHHTSSESKNCKNCHHQVKPIGYMILFSDGFHNFLDGVMIASAFLVNIHLGVVTTILVVLHEIPQEIGDFGVLAHSGFTKNKALFFNFLSGMTAILGALAVILFSNFINGITIYLTALAGGGFLYIAMTDLLPELHQHEHTKKTITLELFFVFLGIMLMFLVLFLENLI